MKALLKNYRQSPRKVRLVADLVRGKKVSDALVKLQFLPKRASGAMIKLIESARANAENNFKVSTTDLIIKEITVNDGPTLKRSNPVSRGRAHPINKRTSHILVTLGTVGEKKSSIKKTDKTRPNGNSAGRELETKTEKPKVAPVKKSPTKKTIKPVANKKSK